MSNYQQAIDEILRFKDTFDGIDPRVSKKLSGTIGEYYVLKKIEEMGKNIIKVKSGQSSCDILLDNKKRIEVKTSILKNDLGPKELFIYGWAVERESQKNTDKFDTMVCVAIDSSFKNPKFYLFTRNEAFSVGHPHHKRYTSLKKRIVIFENENKFKDAITNYPDIITSYEIYINEHPIEFLDRWDKI